MELSIAVKGKKHGKPEADQHEDSEGEQSSEHAGTVAGDSDNEAGCDDEEVGECVSDDSVSSASDSTDDDADEEGVASPKTTTFMWFHIGGKCHIVSLRDFGKPVPACAKDGTPFKTPQTNQGDDWSEELETRGVCPKCAMAWPGTTA